MGTLSRLLYPFVWLLRLPLALFVRLVLVLRGVALFGVRNPLSFVVLVTVVSAGGVYAADERGLVPEIDTTDPDVVDPIGEAEYEDGVSNTSGGDDDGDRLRNRAEARGETDDGARLPDAHPYQKDIYVSVYYAEGVSELSAAEKRAVREMWRSMNVTNPDDTTGVRMHVLDSPPYGGRLDTRISSSGEDEGSIFRRYYTDEYMGDRLCVHHASVFVSSVPGESGGWGAGPGYISVVDGTDTRRMEGIESTVRTLTLTHEVLHNVVGEIEGEHAPSDSHHTTDGYLAAEHTQGTEKELSETVARQLSSRGFKHRCQVSDDAAE